MKRPMGIVVLVLAILATGATQAQAAEPVKPEFDYDGVSFQTHPSDAIITRAKSDNVFDKIIEKTFRYCLKHPKKCEQEKKKNPGLFNKMRKVFTCAGKIVAFVGGNYFAVTKIKKHGGFVKLARETLEAPTKEKKIRILVVFVGEYLGIEEVADSCGFGT